MESPSDSILRFKKRLGVVIHAWAFCLVVPFAFLQLFQQQVFLAAVIFVFMLFNLLVVYLLVKQDTYLFNGWGMAILAAGVVLYSTSITGIVGVLWAYVVILNFYFLLNWRPAALAVSAFIVVEALISYGHLDLNLWLRVVVTMILAAGLTGAFSWLLTEKQAQLIILATTDPLTGCSNRTQLNENLSEAAYNSHRYRIPASIIILDIDHFKAINDTQGHSGGDKILVAFSGLLQSRIRQSDKLFRYGGEEFIILLPNTRIKDAYALAEQIREEIEAHDFSIGHPVTISAGVAEVGHSESWDHWLDRADGAMYRSKNNGRNLVSKGEELIP